MLNLKKTCSLNITDTLKGLNILNMDVSTNKNLYPYSLINAGFERNNFKKLHDVNGLKLRATLYTLLLKDCFPIF